MKILMVSPAYPPYSKGGGSIVKAIVDGLINNGHEVAVIAGFFEGRFKKPLRKKVGGAEIVWLPLYIPYENGFFSYVGLRISMPPTLDSLMYIKKSMDFDEYDIVHLFAFPHLIVDSINLMLRNSKKVLTVHALPKYVNKYPVVKFLYKAYFNTIGRKTIRDSSLITAVSRSTFHTLVQAKVPREKLRIIPNGIYLDNYRKTKYDEFVTQFGIEDKDVVLLTISRFAWYKGFEYAIEAIYRLSKIHKRYPFKYVIMGEVEDPAYFSRIRKIVSDRGLEKSIIFAGFVNENLKLQALSRADIYLAPSLFEGFGLTVLEAMAMGKPVIATRTTGFRDILEHGKTAIIVSPKSSGEIVNSINLLLSDEVLKEYLVNNARRELKKYDWKNIISRYEKLYHDIRSKMD